MPAAFDRFRLQRGRHELSRSEVLEHQRWRLLGGCAEVIAARGYGALTVRDLTKEAAVSKAAFYNLFEGLDDCVAATYEVAAEYAFKATLDCDGEADAGVELSERIASLFGLFATEPALARVLTDNSVLTVARVRPVHGQLVADLASRLACSYSASFRILAAFGYVATQLRLGSPAQLLSSAPELTYLLEENELPNSPRAGPSG